MSPLVLSAYHSLPSFGRNLIASARGWQLKHWRYSRHSERLVQEALERESWTREKWTEWQQNRLLEILYRAVTRVPFYRELWAERKREGDKRSWEDLKAWPVLKKQSLRTHPQAFLADDCDRRRMICDQTSGTSGTPLRIWAMRETVQAWYALFEARLRNWNGVSRHERWAILGGQQIVAGNTQRPPYWVRNWPMHQLYLSANHISNRSAIAYWQILEDFRPTHLITYSSSAAALARELMALDLRCSSLKVVITNAEPVYPWQKELVSRSLAPTLRESYGMGEAVAAASECAHGRLHLWPDAGHIEVLNDFDNEPAPAEASGRVICTGLINPDMPLIRYEVGDRCRPLSWEHACLCGRLLPTIQGIEGRMNDMLITRDGRKVFWINPTFYGLPIIEAQVIQEELEELCVRVVPATQFSADHERTIRTRLCDRLGTVQVKVERVDSIERGPNGKFKPVISKIHSNRSLP